MFFSTFKLTRGVLFSYRIDCAGRGGYGRWMAQEPLSSKEIGEGGDKGIA